MRGIYIKIMGRGIMGTGSMGNGRIAFLWLTWFVCTMRGEGDRDVGILGVPPHNRAGC